MCQDRSKTDEWYRGREGRIKWLWQVHCTPSLHHYKKRITKTTLQGSSHPQSAVDAPTKTHYETIPIPSHISSLPTLSGRVLYRLAQNSHLSQVITIYLAYTYNNNICLHNTDYTDYFTLSRSFGTISIFVDLNNVKLYTLKRAYFRRKYKGYLYARKNRMVNSRADS